MPPALNTDEQAITFSDRNDFDAAQLLHLYHQAPWAQHRGLEQTRAMLAKTDVVISAWDGARLVAFGRVLTDYVYRATIWDVIVDRDYQGRDIGSEIVRRILNHPTLRQIFYLLLTLVALTVVISLKTVGPILVFAMILIPASTAYQLTHSLTQMTLYAMLIGTFCAVSGVLLSYAFDLPSGPSIVLLATSLFFFAVCCSPKRLHRVQAQ